MANPFSITAASDSVRLDSQGRGSMSFTVSNISGRARRGRARVVPAEPGPASWLRLEGEAERDFTADGTHQYTVHIATPPGTAPGRHTFGLDVVSVENPDEEWSQGPKVSCEVPATAPPKKPFPWWILAVILGILLVGGLVLWLVTRNGEPEPEPEPQKAGLLADCRLDADCAQGLVCVSDAPDQPGLCRGDLGFDSCRTKVDCREGLVCEERVCRAPLRAACKEEGDCAQGLTCANGICLAKEGSTCTAGEDCTTQACNNGTCVADTLLRVCRTGGDCGPDQVCGSGSRRCQLNIGQPCKSKQECNSDICKAGTCVGESRPIIPKPRPRPTPTKREPGATGKANQ
jgi:hypothetical protein